MVYKKAAAELIRFDNSDVIITSAENGVEICPGHSDNKAQETCPGGSNQNRDDWFDNKWEGDEKDCRGNSGNKNK